MILDHVGEESGRHDLNRGAEIGEFGVQPRARERAVGGVHGIHGAWTEDIETGPGWTRPDPEITNRPED
jgi:hypothetical protein